MQDHSPTIVPSRRRRYATHRAIAEYWTLGGECQANGEEPLHCDLGEPRCWACDFVEDTTHDGRRDSYDYAHEWLERAHLISHAAGGPAVPSNFALLCHWCHRQMDDDCGRGTNVSRDTAIEWIRGWTARFAKDITAAAADIGLGADDLPAAIARSGWDSVQDAIDAALVEIMRDLRPGRHRDLVVLATAVKAAIDSLAAAR